MNRRGFVGGMAMAALGGRQPRRPDQRSSPPPAVVAPGGTAGTFRGRYVVVYGTGPNSGVFVYSASPAAGNLIGSITASTGTDPYGNAYLSGITSYNQPLPGFDYFAESSMNGQSIFYAASSYAGPWQTTGSIGVTGSLATEFDAKQSVVGTLDYFTWTNAGTLLAKLTATQFQMVVPVIATEPGTFSTPESWHSITSGFPTGWSGALYYQLVATGQIALDFNLSIASGTAISHGETIAVLPTGYRPANRAKFLILPWDNNGTQETAFIAITTSGNVSWQSLAVTVAGASSLEGAADYWLPN